MSNVSTEQLSKNKRIQLSIHFAITLFFMFLFGSVFNPIGVITPMGMRVLGVFLGLLWGWIFLDLALTSIMGFVAIGFTGFIGVNAAFSSGFGNANLLSTLMCFAFAGLMDVCKVTDYIAAKLLSTKALIGRPWLIVFVSFTTMFLIGGAASGMAAAFLMWSILYKIAEMNDIPKDDKFIQFFICGALMTGICGSNLIPFKPATQAFLGFQVAAIGDTPNAVGFIAYNTVMALCLILGLVVVGKFILKLDTSKFIAKPDVFEHLRGAKMGFSQALGFVSLAIFLIILLVPCILPKELQFVQICNQLSTVGAVSVIIIIVGVLKYIVEGEVFDAGKIFKDSVMWDVMLLLAVTFPLADAIKSPDTGILATIRGVLMPVFDSMSIIVFYIVAMVACALITQVVHNVVVGATFISLLAPICVDMGGNPHVLFIMMFWGLSSAYLTPAASAPSAIMHGNQWVQGKPAYLWGCVFMLLAIILSAILGPTLGEFLL